MNQSNPGRFFSGMELEAFVTSTDLLRRTWDVISSPQENESIVSNKGEGLSWKVHKDPYADLTIIAFEVLTHSNPISNVYNTAFSLLNKNRHKLDALKKSEINSSTQLIVTGHGVGGSVASLFTKSLLERIWLGKNRPLCITYGSPLIGNKDLQKAISLNPIWNSCFLHLVSFKDPLPTLFITDSDPQTSAYRPFGTFFFCSDVNSTCFENLDSILELLKALGSLIRHQNQGFQFTDYGHIVENLNHKAIYKQQQNIDINTLVRRMTEQETRFIFHEQKGFKPSKKLNWMKIDMAKLEWYKKDSKIRNIGYYDSYKNMNFDSDKDVVKLHHNLTIYWKEMVGEAIIKPQKGSAAFRRSWLYAGTSYRRMVEPLAIAEFYRKGGKDYMTNRSKHFVLLEKWFRNETTKADRRNVEAESSNFWECIEKAFLSRQQSMVTDQMEDYLDILSIHENEEATSTTCPSFWARVDHLLLSSKEFNVDELDLNGTVKCDIEPCFEARVDRDILSRQGSFKENEKNINGFGVHVDKAILSRQESMASRDRTRKINTEVILTTDSCFWAHVEEALRSCQELKLLKEKQEIFWKLVQFEDYVYRLLRNYEVSSEIFLKESSFMRWWNEYKAIKGTAYNSELANFMNDPSKRVRYSLGAYDFPEL